MGLLDFILIFIVVFFLSIGFLLLRQKQTEWLHSCSEKLGTLCFPAVFIAGAVTFIVGVFYLGYNITWLDIGLGKRQWDYLNALATIIGAGISLIPIFWLSTIQNKLTRGQLDLQYKQNNADMFARACQRIASGTNQEVNAGLHLLESLIAVEQGRYKIPICSVLETLSDDVKSEFIKIAFTYRSEKKIALSKNYITEQDGAFNLKNRFWLAKYLICSMSNIESQRDSVEAFSMFLGTNLADILRDPDYDDLKAFFGEAVNTLDKNWSERCKNTEICDDIHGHLISKLEEQSKNNDLDKRSRQRVSDMLKRLK